MNEKTTLGSSPIMVAAKYCRKEALRGLIQDRRVDLETKDCAGRVVEEAVAAAVQGDQFIETDKAEIVESVVRERLARVEEEGRRDSIEEESIDLDHLHKSRVFGLLQDLLGELLGLHANNKMKVMKEQENESLLFNSKLNSDFQAFINRQSDELTFYKNKILRDKKEFDQRQDEVLKGLLRSQHAEVENLKGSTSYADEASPKSVSSRANSRRPSLKTHMELPSCETLSDASGPR